ncbi:OsmC family protein [Aquibium sp. A9E412]|uniref:OsmC family protein n=1 Tax=Aquibium sp. A9E412 TaxID=2976767 RepID=UPI0025AF7F7A|nr:OsmC family protein [Aquibium sp. A9E412]MDN2567610.1 OsmC family protein [Aquibium sp. A9E412]
MTEPPKSFDVVIRCSGKAVGKMRNEARVDIVEPFVESHEMASDEGPFHGGDGTAPPPLTHFVGGFVTCLMTQIRAFAKRFRITLDALEVEAEFQWKGLTVPGRPYKAEPVGIRLDIAIASAADEAALVELVQAAREGCFVEAIISERIAVSHRLKTQTGWVEC